MFYAEMGYNLGMKSLRFGFLRFVIFVSVLGCRIAHSDWTATSLHQEGALHTWARAITSGMPGGTLRTPETAYAMIYDRSGAARNVTPASVDAARILGMRDGVAVGDTVTHGVVRAALWNAQTGDYADMHPAGTTDSVLYGAGGNQRVGYVRLGDPSSLGNNRAALWFGHWNVYTPLHPVGDHYYYSAAYGTDGQIQAGAVNGEAAIWRGTQRSYQNIHPQGYVGSAALAAHSGRQAGWAVAGPPGRYHAALWSGSAESFVDLHPPTARDSWVNDLFGDYQAGWAYWPTRKAVLWHGSAESAMELHSLLPPEYTHSEAEGIEVDAFGSVTVVGWAYNGMHGRNEAIVWQMAVPETRLADGPRPRRPLHLPPKTESALRARRITAREELGGGWGGDQVFYTAVLPTALSVVCL